MLMAMKSAKKSAPAEPGPDGPTTLSAQIKEVFQRYDSSGDGSLSKNELRKAFTALSPTLTDSEIERFIIEVDSSGDGEVSHTEFMKWLKLGGAAVEALKKAIQSEGDARAARIKKCFERYDISGDGSLDISEMRTVLKGMGTFTTQEVGIVCQDLDRNGDGDISFLEFARWVRSPTTTKEIMKAKAILAPSDDDGLEGVFYTFCGAGHSDMDGKSFLRMLRDCNFLDVNFTEKDADLLFGGQKLKAKGQRTIGFNGFELALRLIAETKGISKDEMRDIVLESQRPVLQGTKAEANRFHDGGKAAAAPKAKRTKPKVRVMTEAELKQDSLPVDNTELWKKFGIDTPAGRTLKKLYAPPEKMQGIGQRSRGPMPPDMYIAVNNLAVASPGLQYRRSMRIADICAGYVPWGECVQGDLVHICWLKVGDCFLPTEVNGVRLLKKFSGPGSPAGSAAAAGTMRKSASLPAISGSSRGTPVNRMAFQGLVEGSRLSA